MALLLKHLLISTWVLFMALGLNLSLPAIANFFATHVPLTWNIILTFLRPPYLFLLLNAIILTIAASSCRFHHPTPPPPQSLPHHPPPYYLTKYPLPLPIEDDPAVLVDVKPVLVNGVPVTDELDGTVATPLPEMTPPPAAPTLEEVWKSITDGRSRAVTKRSETTVKERRRRRNPMVCARSASMRKEVELSQDELNERVEAFIRKFNEEMRLQKQQSLNRSFHGDHQEEEP